MLVYSSDARQTTQDADAIFQLTHEIWILQSRDISSLLCRPKARLTGIINLRSQHAHKFQGGTFDVNDPVLQRNYIDKYLRIKRLAMGKIIFRLFSSLLFILA